MVAEVDDPRVSHWNYRTFVRSVPTGGDDFEDQFFIGEAYYDDEGNVVMWSDAVPPMAETKIGLWNDLSRMTECMGKPVLVCSELPGGDK